MKLKNNKINITKNILRDRGPKISRQNFLRLDKNERVSKFDNIFFKNLLKKFHMKICHHILKLKHYMICYPLKIN